MYIVHNAHRRSPVKIGRLSYERTCFEHPPSFLLQTQCQHLFVFQQMSDALIHYRNVAPVISQSRLWLKLLDTAYIICASYS